MKWRPISKWATVSLLAFLFSVPVLAVGAVAADPPGTVALRDPRIAESSGLVDLGSTWVTTNDSGDTAQVFTVSPMTGRTIGITHFHADVVDVEALAPAGGNAVWVGDIGDNDGERASVSVYKVKVGTGRIDVNPSPFRLVYPRSRPNAESLFVDRQGRLNVVTKSFGGGIVYRAPAQLSTKKPNRLAAVGRVSEFATDAALTRDGKHFIVRGPLIAGVYTLPDFRRVASFRLPLQPQGEGISVGPTGLVRVSTEGARSAVRRVSLPASVTAALEPPATPTPTPTPSPSATPSPSSSPSPAPSNAPPSNDSSSENGLGSIDPPWLMWCIPAVIAVGALGIGLGLRRRTE